MKRLNLLHMHIHICVQHAVPYKPCMLCERRRVRILTDQQASNVIESRPCKTLLRWPTWVQCNPRTALRLRSGRYCKNGVDPANMYKPNMFCRRSTSCKTSISWHILPARRWIRPIRLASQKAGTAQSFHRIYCSAATDTRIHSRTSRRSALLALTTLLVHPSMTAVAETSEEKVRIVNCSIRAPGALWNELHLHVAVYTKCR